MARNAPERPGRAEDLIGRSFQVAPSPAAVRETLRAEVDRVLDKINSQGFGALTEEEKRLLDEAKDLLSRQ